MPKKNSPKNLSLDVLAGNNIYSRSTSTDFVNGADLSVAGFYNIDNANTVTSAYGSYLSRKLGFYAQANLDYKDMLTLGLTGRYDGSSVLSVNKQFYPYGSASGAFVFTKALGLDKKQQLRFWQNKDELLGGWERQRAPLQLK